MSSNLILITKGGDPGSNSGSPTILLLRYIIMGRIFVTSDLHFNHNKPFIYEPRGFQSVTGMNNAIIYNWNSVVEPDDEVYILGDVMLGDNAEGLRLLKQLKGHTHIILGNHDTDTRRALYENCCNVVEVTYATVIHYNHYHFYLTHYPCITSNFDYNKPLTARILNLCGHAHTTDKFANWKDGTIYHCELDAHNNSPVLLDTIIKEMECEYQKMRHLKI